MELWDAYNADGTLAGFDLVRGSKIPPNYYHLVCEAVIQHTDGEYLLMQRSFQKEIFPVVINGTFKNVISLNHLKGIKKKNFKL